MVYTGIGSRKTPSRIQEFMYEFAWTMAKYNHVLRSGRAEGADIAFECGVLDYMEKTEKTAKDALLGEIYLPWSTFGGSVHCLNNTWFRQPKLVPYFDRPSQTALSVCNTYYMYENYNPKQSVKKLYARNLHQVLGWHLDKATDLIVCWTPDGSLDGSTPESGGTGYALRAAEAYGIPVLNLYHEGHKFRAQEIMQYPNENWPLDHLNREYLRKYSEWGDWILDSDEGVRE